MNRDEHDRDTGPRPLDYRSPVDDRPSDHASQFVGGLLSGCVVVFLSGFLVAISSSGSGYRARALVAGVVFIGIALAGLAYAAWPTRSAAKPLLAGLLMGIAVAALIEGWCFVSFA